MTCLGSRGFEWLKRVSNFIGNDILSLRTTQGTLYSIYNSLYTSSTRFGKLEKMVKLLVNCGAIRPRLWAEMALQILWNPQNMSKRIWGLLLDLIYYNLVWLRVLQHRCKLHIRMHKFNDSCLRKMTCKSSTLTHKFYK